MEPWEFPDIEDELKTVFADGLTVPAVTVVPNPRPATFVQVLRTGGPRMTFKSDGPILTVTAWAPTRSAAAQLLNEARSLLYTLRGELLPTSERPVYSVAELGGPVNDPDPVSKTPRMSIVVRLHVGGAAPVGS